MPRVFISYRRDDSSGHAGRLIDHLAQRLGSENVFRDIDSIPLGRDFVPVLRKALDGCDVMLVVIGRSWLATKPDGTRRIDDADDWVRLETSEGLRRSIPVIPVLVQGAERPDAGQLPSDLRPLANRQAIALLDDQWEAGIRHLFAKLGVTGETAPAATARGHVLRRSVVLAVTLLIAGAVGAALMNRGASPPASNAATAQGSQPAARPPAEPVVPDLRITALDGASAPRTLAGYDVLQASAPGSGTAERHAVYPRGARIAVDLSHDHRGDATITLHGIELEVASFQPGVQRSYAYKANGDAVIGAGPITPLVYHVAVFGRRVGPSMRVIDAKRNITAIARSGNFLDTEEPQLFQLSKGDDTQVIHVDVTAEEAGLYELAMVFTYAVLGTTKQQRTQPSIWIYYDGS